MLAERDDDASIACFRGVTYASISERWTQSRTRHSLSGTFDATKFGHKCPQTLHSSILPVSLKEADVAFSEFECLNLNVTVPLAALPKIESKEATALLPVMVWVHGCVIVSWFDVFPILVSQQFDS